MAALDELGIAPFQLLVSNLYPFAQTVASGATPDGDDRADRHRRPGHGAARRRRTTRRSPSWSDPGTLRRRHRRGPCRRVHAGAAPQRLAARRLPAHRRRTTSPWPDGWRALRPTTSSSDAATGSRDGSRSRLRARRRSCATARTRTSAPRSTSTSARTWHRRTPSSSHGKEMSYNNYVGRRCGVAAAYDYAEPVRGDHQARQPVRHRRRLGHRRSAPQGPRVRPGERVRRRDRGEPSGDAWRWPTSWPTSSPRWSWRPHYDDGAVEAFARKKNHAAAAGSEPTGLGHRAASGVGRAARAERRPDRRAGRRPGQLDAGHRRARRRGDSAPTSASPGAPSARSSRTPSCWPRTEPRVGVGHGPGQPRGRGPARRRPRRRPCARARWRHPTRSSRSPTGWRSCSPPGCGPSSSPADRCVTSWPSTARGRRRDHVPHRHPALHPLDPWLRSLTGASRPRTYAAVAFEDTDFVRVPVRRGRAGGCGQVPL